MSPEPSKNYPAPAACLPADMTRMPVQWGFMTLGHFNIARSPLPTPGKLRSSGDSFQFQNCPSQLWISECGSFLWVNLSSLACHLLCLILSHWLNPIGLGGWFLWVLGPYCSPDNGQRTWPALPCAPTPLPPLLDFTLLGLPALTAHELPGLEPSCPLKLPEVSVPPCPLALSSSSSVTSG